MIAGDMQSPCCKHSAKDLGGGRASLRRRTHGSPHRRQEAVSVANSSVLSVRISETPAGDDGIRPPERSARVAVYGLALESRCKRNDPGAFGVSPTGPLAEALPATAWAWVAAFMVRRARPPVGPKTSRGSPHVRPPVTFDDTQRQMGPLNGARPRVLPNRCHSHQGRDQPRGLSSGDLGATPNSWSCHLAAPGYYAFVDANPLVPVHDALAVQVTLEQSTP